MTAVADIGDIVRVVNNGDQPFTIGWDSRQYRLEPGKDTFVPFEACCLWFGDPRSTNSIQSAKNQHGIVSFIPDRDSEIRRLRVKYGNIGGDERFVDPAPDVTIYDLTGEQIVTVLDDPSGDSITVAQPTVVDQSNLIATIERQQAQINLLLENLGLQKKAEGTGEVTTQGLDDFGDDIGGDNGAGDGEDEDGGDGGETGEVDDDGLPVDPSINS